MRYSSKKTIHPMSLMLLALSAAVTTFGATYYVRPDGGTAAQCSGLVDAPYPGKGKNKPCAFNHPFWAIAPVGNNPTKLQGGDTLIIDGSDNAQYMMGWGAPNIRDTSVCYSHWPWGCFMRPVPSGPDPAHPTRILGKGWDKGCPEPPQLWGTERANRVLNLSGSKNVEIQCLEITDHSSCQEHGPNPCNRNTVPYGPWATTGLAATDSENVFIKNVNIHGMAYRGVHAGRLKNWTIEDTKIVGNSFVGWDGDVGAYQSSNSGTLTFNRVTIAYNGCGETYPEGKPYNCYSQDQGGYGDGLGTHLTGGTWIFNECDISHNVSDGLDLLYHSGNGGVLINRSRFEGNAGNQVKVGTRSVIGNSLIIGNCAYFADQPFTWHPSTFNNCRAGGNAVAVSVRNGMTHLIYNSTITSNGDTIIQSAGDSCNGTEVIVSRNNIYIGGTEYNDGHDKAALYWAAGKTGNGDGSCGSVALDDQHSVIYNTKYYPSICDGKEGSVCGDPKLMDDFTTQYYSGEAFDARLRADSPARGLGVVLAGKSSLDYNGYDRGASWDAGALEYGTTEEDEQSTGCTESATQCSSQTECGNAGFYWYDGACHDQPKPPQCSDGVQYCESEDECVSEGYHWYNGSCHVKAPSCADGVAYCEDEGACEAQGYHWYNGSCHVKAPSCADGIAYCTEKKDCESAGHFWYDGACHDQKKEKKQDKSNSSKNKDRGIKDDSVSPSDGDDGGADSNGDDSSEIIENLDKTDEGIRNDHQEVGENLGKKDDEADEVKKDEKIKVNADKAEKDNKKKMSGDHGRRDGEGTDEAQAGNEDDKVEDKKVSEDKGAKADESDKTGVKGQVKEDTKVKGQLDTKENAAARSSTTPTPASSSSTRRGSAGGGSGGGSSLASGSGGSAGGGLFSSPGIFATHGSFDEKKHGKKKRAEKKKRDIHKHRDRDSKKSPRRSHRYESQALASPKVAAEQRASLEGTRLRRMAHRGSSDESKRGPRSILVTRTEAPFPLRSEGLGQRHWDDANTMDERDRLIRQEEKIARRMLAEKGFEPTEPNKETEAFLKALEQRNSEKRRGIGEEAVWGGEQNGGEFEDKQDAPDRQHEAEAVREGADASTDGVETDVSGPQGGADDLGEGGEESAVSGTLTNENNDDSKESRSGSSFLEPVKQSLQDIRFWFNEAVKDLFRWLK